MIHRAAGFAADNPAHAAKPGAGTTLLPLHAVRRAPNRSRMHRPSFLVFAPIRLQRPARSAIAAQSDPTPPQAILVRRPDANGKPDLPCRQHSLIPATS